MTKTQTDLVLFRDMFILCCKPAILKIKAKELDFYNSEILGDLVNTQAHGPIIQKNGRLSLTNKLGIPTRMMVLSLFLMRSTLNCTVQLVFVQIM